jgi:hypothetical protein
MSIAIQGNNGTCPCQACQKALYKTPIQREIDKMKKLGMTLPKWAKGDKR